MCIRDSYTVAQVGATSRPRFTITSNSRSAKGAKVIADLVQKEYVKLHKSSKSEKVEFVKKTLEDLLEGSLSKEKMIATQMADFKRERELPFLEDEKRDTGSRKSQYSSEITTSRLEKIRISSLLRQILAIRTRIGTGSVSSSSKDVNLSLIHISEPTRPY